MTDSPENTDHFQQWEYERRRDAVEQDFEGAYRYSPDYAVEADMTAALITHEFMRRSGVGQPDEQSGQDQLGRIQLAMKKVAFMFSNPNDRLDIETVLLIALDHYEQSGRNLTQTADRVVRYVTYLAPYFKAIAGQAGDGWMEYSSERAFSETRELMERSVEADYGETDL